jgi:phosphoenolpyruvate carboxylase
MEQKINDKIKYLKYKIKYNKIKKQQGGNKHKYDSLMSYMIMEYYKLKIIINLENLIYNIQSFYNNIQEENPNKSITIIGIGDSPIIILQIFEKIFNDMNYNIKYLPISSLRKTHPLEVEYEEKIGKEKMMELNNLIDSDLILWVDYISSGLSFYKFKLLLPKEIRRKSYYYLYGNNSTFIEKIKDKNNINFFNTSINDKLEYLFSQIIGASEYYNIRCLPKMKIDENYQVKLYNIKDLPIIENGEGCIEFADYLYNDIEKNL